jgi:hypothetical protein
MYQEAVSPNDSRRLRDSTSREYVNEMMAAAVREYLEEEGHNRREAVRQRMADTRSRTRNVMTDTVRRSLRLEASELDSALDLMSAGADRARRIR